MEDDEIDDPMIGSAILDQDRQDQWTAAPLSSAMTTDEYNARIQLMEPSDYNQSDYLVSTWHTNDPNDTLNTMEPLNQHPDDVAGPINQKMGPVHVLTGANRTAEEHPDQGSTGKKKTENQSDHIGQDLSIGSNPWYQPPTGKDRTNHPTGFRLIEEILDQGSIGKENQGSTKGIKKNYSQDQSAHTKGPKNQENRTEIFKQIHQNAQNHWPENFRSAESRHKSRQESKEKQASTKNRTGKGSNVDDTINYAMSGKFKIGQKREEVILPSLTSFPTTINVNTVTVMDNQGHPNQGKVTNQKHRHNKIQEDPNRTSSKTTEMDSTDDEVERMAETEEMLEKECKKAEERHKDRILPTLRNWIGSKSRQKKARQIEEEEDADVVRNLLKNMENAQSIAKEVDRIIQTEGQSKNEALRRLKRMIITTITEAQEMLKEKDEQSASLIHTKYQQLPDEVEQTMRETIIQTKLLHTHKISRENLLNACEELLMQLHEALRYVAHNKLAKESLKFFEVRAKANEHRLYQTEAKIAQLRCENNILRQKLKAEEK